MITPRKTKLALAALALALAASVPAMAGPLDFLTTKTEVKETFLVYDLPGYTGAPGALKDKVREALTYHGDDAFVKENLISGDAPQFPGKLQLKTLNLGVMSINMPGCPDAVFTISSTDNSMSSSGDSSVYMACGYRYSGGYRVDFYARYQSTSGGVGGLLSGKTIGGALVGALGFNTTPQQFIDASIKKMEDLFAAQNWTYNIVEMTPALDGKTVVPDPLVVAKASAEKKKTDRAARLSARSELQKLGIDASDRARLIRAVESGDEDVVELFVEAGAVDVHTKDSTGKAVADYAQSASIKSLLAN